METFNPWLNKYLKVKEQTVSGMYDLYFNEGFAV